MLKKVLFTMILLGAFSLTGFAQSNNDKKDKPPKGETPKIKIPPKNDGDKPKNPPSNTNPDQGKKPKKPEGEG